MTSTFTYSCLSIPIVTSCNLGAWQPAIGVCCHPASDKQSQWGNWQRRLQVMTTRCSLNDCSKRGCKTSCPGKPHLIAATLNCEFSSPVPAVIVSQGLSVPPALTRTLSCSIQLSAPNPPNPLERRGRVTPAGADLTLGFLSWVLKRDSQESNVHLANASGAFPSASFEQQRATQRQGWPR